MARQQRMKLMNTIGRKRNSSVICYITGDRENLNTRIAPDVIPVLYRHLEKLPDRRNIDLFLYSRGGDIITPWRIVQLIREYTSRFCVLVPFRSYSAGTLLCLGADEIVMGKMGELGPIDPSVVNPYNPKDSHNPSARIPVNIQDVYSYLALASENGGLGTKAMVNVFSILAERIHPLALGNVHRNYLLIRSLASKMLRLRNFCLSSEDEEKIVDNLTEKLYAHDYTITRREAKEEIGLPVSYPNAELETAGWMLYEDFASELQLGEPFYPGDVSPGCRIEFEVPAGALESSFGRDFFVYSGVVEGNSHDVEGQKVTVDILKQGWKTID